MLTEAKKLSLIQHILEEQDEVVIEKVEALFKKGYSAQSDKKGSIYDFVGIITNKEAEDMQRAIEETSGKIHPDDWK